MTLPSGARLGSYEIVALLGAGGMGEVYRARDTRLLRDVALKVISPAVAGNPTLRERFTREARAAAALNHANVCTIYEVGPLTADTTTPFIAMELLEGETLRDRLAREPIPTAGVIDIAIALADALDATHARGLVHRDLKPANIFLTARGLPKIVDFGVVKAVEVETTSLSHVTPTAPETAAGMAVGTIAYMSPEQLRGEPIDGRSDLFSFGIVLYEMATGHHPFQSVTLALTCDAILNHPPADLGSARSECPAGVVEVILRALEKDRGRRYQSAAMMRDALIAVKRSLAAGTIRHADTPLVASTVAVLPFVDMSPQKDQEYFCDGMAEELINALTSLRGLRVTSRTSAFQFKGRSVDIGEIGARLKVEAVLDGSVRRSGNRLRVTAQLVKTSDGYHLWSERYDRELDDVFAVQDDIVHAIVEQLKVQLAGDPDAALVKRRTDDLEAYTLYLQGRHHWLRDPGGYSQALASFEQAVERDPSFAAAHAGLADLHLTLAWSGAVPSGPEYDVARHHAARAVALDDTLGDAHRSLALVQMTFDWNFSAAERSLTRALALDPGSGITCVELGLLLARLGRFDEGVRYAQRARTLDPTTAIVRCYVAYTLALARAFSSAITEAGRAVELDRRHPAAWISRTRLLSADDRHDEAVASAREMLATVGRDALTLGAAAFALIRAGLRDEGDRVIAELMDPDRQPPASPMVLADIAVALGDADRACAWLEKAVDDKALGVLNLGTAPSYAPLRSNPRFRALLTRIGLPILSEFPPVY